MELSQKSGCFRVLRLQFFRHRALSNGDLFHTRDLQDLPPKSCEKRWIKSEFSCEFFRSFLLRLVNISQKVAKFSIEFDFQMSSFSSNPDKNNRTQKIGLSHPGTSGTRKQPLATQPGRWPTGWDVSCLGMDNRSFPAVKIEHNLD